MSGDPDPGTRSARGDSGTHPVDARQAAGVQVGHDNTQIIYNYGNLPWAGEVDSKRHPADSAWAVAVSNEEHSGAVGAGVVIGARRVLTCARLCAGQIGENGRLKDPLWVRFSKARPPGRGAAAPGTQSRRVTGVQLPEGQHDLAVLLLEDTVPAGVRAAPLRCPVPEDLVGLDWWAYGFPKGQPHGNAADGTVGTALGEGFVRLDTHARYRTETGFSGGGLWSPDYEAVVGIIGAAFTRDGDDRDDRIGDALAIALCQADLRFGPEGPAAFGKWSAEQAGEVAMSSWGWVPRDDPEYGLHWRPRARGVDAGSEDGYRFRGRRAALTEITGWLGRDRTDLRALVVTGSPGVGKSAVLGRVVTTAEPGISSELPDDGVVRAVEGSVGCAVHAKGKTALDVAREIARAASARLPAREVDLAPAIRAALVVQGIERFNVVIDALDEAASPAQARLIVSQIVLPLLQQCADAGGQVVIGTRRQDDDGSLIDVFGDAAVLIDLDADEYFSLEDLEAYALATLQQLGAGQPGNPCYADEEVAGPLAAQIARLSGRNFLVAHLIALKHGRYDKEPADLGELTYTVGIRKALGDYLAPIKGVAGVSAADLLTALAYAQAPGLLLDLWIAAVEALYEARPNKKELHRFAQSSAANFLLESSQGSRPVFRLDHQALNDVLVSASTRYAAEDQEALTSAFLGFGRQKGWASAPPYLLQSLSHHAESAAMLDELLTDDEYLLYADLRRLTPQADQATTGAGKQRAELLQLTPYAASTENPQERRALFSVTETIEKLGDSFRADPGSAPYRARWSTAITHKERAAREGHVGGVVVVRSLTLDGKTLLASGGEDEILRIWDPATGRQQRVLEGHAGQVKDIHAFTAGNGRTLLASASTDSAVRIWDLATGRLQRVLEGHAGTVVGVCSFTAEDGRRLLASAGSDEMVRIWDLATGRQQRVLEGHAGTVYAISAFTSAGRTLLTSSGQDGKIMIWDPASGELRKTLERRTAAGEEGNTTAGVRTAMCAFTTADGRIALASTSGDAVGVWDLDREQYQALNGRTRSGGAWQICSFTAGDGRILLATAGPDDRVRIWDQATGQPQRILEAEDEVWSVCTFTADDGSTVLASAGYDPTIQIWDPATGQQRKALKGHSDVPWSVCAFTADDGRTLLASGGDIVRIRDSASGQLQHSLEDSTGSALSVCAFTSGDGRTLLASAGTDAIVRIWDPATGLLERSLEGGKGKVWVVCAFTSGDGRTLLASTGADTVRIWDPATGHLLRTLDGHSGEIWDMCPLVTADGKVLLASAGDDGTARVWDPATGQQQRTLAGVTGDVWAVCAFTGEDGRAFVALGEGDGIIRVWDLATGELKRTLEGHEMGIRGVSAITLSERTLLASCGDDSEVRIWDPATGQTLQVIPVHLTPTVVVAVDGILVLGLSAGLLTIELNLEGSSRA